MSVAMPNLVKQHALAVFTREGKCLQTMFFKTSTTDGSHDVQMTGETRILKGNEAIVSSDIFSLDNALFVTLMA